MVITNQEMNSHFDDDVKKPGPTSLRLNKKFLGFLAFAVIILQVADTLVLWLIGSSKNSQINGSGLPADIFMSTFVIFCILNVIYTKFFLKSRKVCVAEESSAEEMPEEIQQSATRVVDTMKVKGPPCSGKNKQKPSSTEPVWVSSQFSFSQFTTSMQGVATLNAKAKKFVPLAPNGTLDSHAPVFMPHAHIQKEDQLLKSEFDGKDVGSVVYRSTHWLNEICPNTKKTDTNVARKSKSPEPAKLMKASEPASRRKPSPKMKWVPKQQIVWASQWSNLKGALRLAT